MFETTTLMMHMRGMVPFLHLSDLLCGLPFPGPSLVAVAHAWYFSKNVLRKPISLIELVFVFLVASNVDIKVLMAVMYLPFIIFPALVNLLFALSIAMLALQDGS
jgi:hypothetical protein